MEGNEGINEEKFEKKDNLVRLRLTDSERKILVSACQRRGMSMSQIVRDLIKTLEWRDDGEAL